MPSIKDFEKAKKNNSEAAEAAESAAAPTQSETETEAPKKAKRRPGRDQEAGEGPRVKVVDVDVAASTQDSQVQGSSESAHSTSFSSSKTEDHVEIAFPGSEILRSRFPRPFKVLEGIATDWVKDGSFEGLPVGHPLAQFFLAKGLRRAKDIEKKVMESPVTEKVTMQVFQAGMKATSHLANVKEQVDLAKNNAKTHVDNLKKKIGKS